MDVREAIYRRRAVRDYQQAPVPEQKIRELIDAAIHAPTGRNLQPWAFVVIQDRELLERLSRRVRLMMNAEAHADDPEFNVFYNANTLVLLCAKSVGYHPDWDCCLAAENLMIIATSMGLGTCPIGSARTVFELGDVKELLSIPDDYDPVLPVIVGYPKDVPRAPAREPAQILSWKVAPSVATVL